MKRPEKTDSDVVRSWVRDVIARSGLKPTPLAKRAGLSPSTLVRALEGRTELERRSIAAIALATGIAPPPMGAAAAPLGLAEPDVSRWDDQPTI